MNTGICSQWKIKAPGYSIHELNICGPKHMFIGEALRILKARNFMLHGMKRQDVDPLDAATVLSIATGIEYVNDMACMIRNDPKTIPEHCHGCSYCPPTVALTLKEDKTMEIESNGEFDDVKIKLTMKHGHETHDFVETIWSLPQGVGLKFLEDYRDQLARLAALAVKGDKLLKRFLRIHLLFDMADQSYDYAYAANEVDHLLDRLEREVERVKNGGKG